MLRIAIVEDEIAVQEQLQSYISRYFEGLEDHYKITVFSDGDEILENYSANYDLILLDIQMKRLDGMVTAHRIRELDENVYLIFVTNMANCAIKGYAVNALDFVLKPVNYLMLKALLQRVERKLEAQAKKYITLPMDKGLMRIDVNDITYVETSNHTSILHTSKGNYALRETMKNLESQLSGYHFSRCNNCYLVNLLRVEKVDRSTVTVAGEALAISRPRYKAFMEALTEYVGGVKA